jgi:hypothetical protein
MADTEGSGGWRARHHFTYDPNDLLIRSPDGIPSIGQSGPIRNGAHAPDEG